MSHRRSPRDSNGRSALHPDRIHAIAHNSPLHWFTLAFLAALAVTTAIAPVARRAACPPRAAHRGARAAASSPPASRSRRTRRPPTTRSRRPGSGCIETLVGAALLLALHARRRPARPCSSLGACVRSGRLRARHRAHRLGGARSPGVVDLPFALVRTFGIEARFGFNRMTLGTLSRRSGQADAARRCCSASRSSFSCCG